MTNEFVIIDSPLGKIKIIWNSLGITSLDFDCNEEPTSDIPASSSLPVAEKVLHYFRDGRTAFDLPVFPKCTTFQFSVWAELLKIPPGQTTYYEQIAKRLGDVKLARAVGTAVGKNPIPLIIPCHRVVGKDGALTGYSGGLWRKKWLLEHEMKYAQPALFV